MALAPWWPVAALVVAGLNGGEAQAGPERAGYRNPLPVSSPAGPVESCADPTAIGGPAGDASWYMICTTDPLSGSDRDAAGELVFHLLPTFRSSDLVHWTYVGDAFDRGAGAASPPPGWADPTAVFWAPEIDRLDGRYVLTFAVTDVATEAGGEPGCDEDSAIGLAVGDSPAGPWEPMAEPLVAPRRAGEGCEFFWTLDPEVIETPEGARYLYYGSFYGGTEARALTALPDGRWSAPEGTAVPIAIPNRYEGAEIVERDGFYYLFASATNCCAGPQTGYAVFVARSEDPLGPFLDRDGVSVLEQGVGGTPVLYQNGNGWVGPGHNTLIQDRAGQWWTLYHAVEEEAPFFDEEPGFTRRPVLLDRVDWQDGWPIVNRGAGPSVQVALAPALRPGEVSPPPSPDLPTEALAPFPDLSDDFEGAGPGPQWRWVRPPAEGIVVAGGRLAMSTQDADLFEDRDDASVLLEPLPEGDVTVEVRVRLVPPAEGCCHNYVQAGLVLRGDDDTYVKLVLVSIWETRQTEFARELPVVPPGAPRYGNTVVGPPGEDWTWLRISVERRPGRDLFTPWTSRDGAEWVRGGAWTHDLGEGAGIGLVAMGAAGFTAEFDDLVVSRPVASDP
jgi:arabinan endo-1,5-alpha-L-arabinosidase